MYCPKCRGEFQERVKRCPDCDVELVAELPPPATDELEWQDTVVVFETNDPAAMIVAKSLLESEEIPFVSVGDRAQDLIGVGRLFAGSNPLVGPMRIEVPREHEDAARRILQPMEERAKAAPSDIETSEE